MSGRPSLQAMFASSALAIVLAVGLLTPAGADGETVEIPSVWGSVLDVDIDGTFDSVHSNLVMGLGYVGGSQDQRAITEFDLSRIPSGATIVNATFRAWVFGGSGGPDPEVEVYGYVGDGMVTLADGYETNQLLTSFQCVFAQWTELDMTSFVDSLFGVEQWAGLHFRNVTWGTFREFDPNVTVSPRLIVEYDAPTPAEPTTWGRIKAIYER